MGVFTGIGDFFRGAFGEDDEEKKRRKQREAQAAQAAKQQQIQQQAAQQKMQQQNVKSVNDLFKKPNVATADPLGVTQKLQQAKPAAAPKPDLISEGLASGGLTQDPAVIAKIPKPDMDFKGYTNEGVKKRKFAVDQDIINVNRSYKTNVDKYVADFDKLNDDTKSLLVKKYKEQAEAGDQAAINSLQALEDTNRIKKGSLPKDKLQTASDYAGVPGRSILRVATGIGQGVSGLYDLATPGKGTNRVSKGLDKTAKFEDESAKDAGVETAYKVGNVVGEIGSYFIPSTLATKIAGKFPKGAKLTEDIVEKVAANVDDAGEAGKVRKFLADRMRKGWTLDQALEESIQTAKYTGENASKGNDTSPTSVATDVATSVGGSLLFPNKFRAAFRKGDDAADEAVEDVVGASLAGGAEQVDNALTKNVDEVADDVRKKGLQNATDEELEQLAKDVESPAYERKNVTDEQARRAAEAEKAAFNGDPLNKPAYQVKKEAAAIVAEEEKKLNDFINSNPGLNKQQIEAAREGAKVRVQKLVEDLQQSRYDALKAVDDQGSAVDATVEAGQKAAGDAQAAQAATTAPDPSTIVQATPVTGNPEVLANDAYADASNAVVDAIGQGGDELKRGNILYNNPLSRFFNQKQQAYIESIDAARLKLAEQTQKAIQSENKATSGTAEIGRMFFKNFGQSEPVRSTLIKRTSQLQNSGRVAVEALKSMEDLAAKDGNPAEVYEKIYRVLEEPDFLQRVFGDANKLDVTDLNPNEKAAFDQLVNLNKIRNDINLQTGIINPEQHAAYANGMHSPRIYDINVEHPELKDFVGSSRYLDLKAGIKRNNINDVPDYILSQLVDSPFQASALRLEGALKNLANAETLQNLDNLGGLTAKAANNNFVPLTGKKYGKYEGKFIDKQLLSQIDGKDYYNSEIGQRIGDTIDTFHNSILGAPGRLYKKFRTTLSPGTIVGNIGSGQFAFSGAANINPVTSMVRTMQATKQLASGGINRAVQEAELAGLFAGDTGRLINNSKAPESAIRKGADNLWDKANNFYGGIDKATALGWFNEFRARGLSPEQAVARVHLGMQNYANAGRAVNALSDSPVIGKPFARFTPELLRIAKNAAIYNPVGTAAKAGGLYAGANYLSENSGETPEERKAREEAPGQTKIGNLSLNLPFGDHSVNIARAIGLNFPQEPNGDPNSAIIRQLNPLADMTRTNAQGETVFAPNQAVSDMFYRQIADQVVDRDFMGRQITDPTNKTYFEDGDASVKKYEGEPTGSEHFKNRLRAAAQGLPFAPEIDNLASAASGKEDYYGKERSLPESIGRLFGVKVESNTDEVRKKRTDTNRFFDEDLPAVQNFLKENPDLAQKYYQIKNPTRTRPTGEDDPGTKVSDLITPEKWDIINSDTSGRLFGFMKSQEERLHERSIAENAADPSKKIKPVDPVYQLPADQAKYVAELRSRPSGDDIEAQEILRATSTWYADYEDRYHNYLTQNSAYFDSQPEFEGAAKDNPRVKEYGDASDPIEQPALIKQYYQIKDKDPEAAKTFYKANKDTLSKTFDSYAKQRLDRINKLRKIEGYEPISLEVFKNKTFGFNIDDGSGFGNGGGEDTVNLLGDLSNFTGTVNAPKEINAQAMPQLAQFFNTLNAGGKLGKQKPTLGASASGR